MCPSRGSVGLFALLAAAQCCHTTSGVAQDIKIVPSDASMVAPPHISSAHPSQRGQQSALPHRPPQALSPRVGRLYLRGGCAEGPLACAPGAATGAEARDVWDFHMMDFGGGEGRVMMFRHKDFGTVVEMLAYSVGFFRFIEGHGGNATTCSSFGTILSPIEERQLTVNGSNAFDPTDGLVAPDMLGELAGQAGQRPMAAEWVDCGHWEAWCDRGTSTRCIQITNHFSNASLALTSDGFLFVGADAGPMQPSKPWGLRVSCGGPAEQMTQREARALLNRLKGAP